MLKAKAQGKGGPLLLVGLSEENVSRLKADRPIVLKMEEFQIDGGVEIFLFYGRTESEMATMLRREGLLPELPDIMDAGLAEHYTLKEQDAKVLVATVGLPRSGKSTWARSQSYPIVCPDEIRTALHGHRFIAEAEPFVWAICKVMVKALFGAGHQFVILDACNTTRKRRDEWQSSEWALRFKHVETAAGECHARAAESGDAELLDSVIERMSAQFEDLGEDELIFT